MSGGVDSSTAAALLKREGYDVIGVGLRLADSPAAGESEGSCCGLEGMDDARRVASRIGIPFYVLNYEKIFKESVIDYFCRAYLSGETPNPCIECNRIVKFGHLLRFADLLGASYIATGHYARIFQDRKTRRYLLKKGRDPRKDQSYFLYSLTQEQLSRILFPLGEMTKEETRKLAKSFGLDTCEKPASQDVCFLGNEDYRDFLARKFPDLLVPGPIVNMQGRILGRHRGVAFYTVGQRRGLGVATGAPLHVVIVETKTGRIVVGTKEETLKRRISLNSVNWISFNSPGDSLSLNVKIRYRHQERPALVFNRQDGRADIQFSIPQPAPAAGQSAVFYEGDLVVGGGIIEKKQNESEQENQRDET